MDPHTRIKTGKGSTEGVVQTRINIVVVIIIMIILYICPNIYKWNLTIVRVLLALFHIIPTFYQIFISHAYTNLLIYKTNDNTAKILVKSIELQ